MIKSAKKAIKAIARNTDVNDEEFVTIFTWTEGLLNSRPLTYQISNPEDETPSTPNHFLHGQVGGHFSPSAVDEKQFNLKKRWQKVQEIVRHFWQRWLKEWLPYIGERTMWLPEKKNIAVGDIVVVTSPETPRRKWPLGKIIHISWRK